MIVDPTTGTCILGSLNGNLITTYRDRFGETVYDHKVTGTLQYLEDGWLLLKVDDEIARYYASAMKQRFGINLNWRAKAGAHVSVIRGEPLSNGERWGHDEGREIEILYTHQVYTNGEHWWLNVMCDELANVRSSYGLPSDKRFFHLTIGRT